MLKYFFTYCILMFCLLSVFAQNKVADTIYLNETNIQTFRAKQFFIGSNLQLIDSLSKSTKQQQSLSELLNENASVFIRNYGNASLSTASFRGSNSYHTAVLWNGINLQNPMNGQIDFSLMPVFLSDEITIQYGGNGSLFGSGAVGGVVHLNDKPKFNSGFKSEILLGAASFENFQQAVKISYGNNTFYTSTKVLNQNAANNFNYIYKEKEFNQTHAGFVAQGFQQQISLLLKKQKQLTIYAWWQRNERDIPSALLTTNIHSKQNDETQRLAIEFKQSNKKHLINFRTALLNDELNYTDDNTAKQKNNSRAFNTQLEDFIFVNSKNKIHVGINHIFGSAQVDGYDKEISQHRISAFAFYRSAFLTNKIISVFGLRHELIDGKSIPVMPSYGFEILLNKFKFFGNVSRSYRIPTFNDLYWKIGGNPNLKSEEGWNQELSCLFNTQHSAINLSATLTGFNRNMNDLIQWLPDAGNYWTPLNVSKVWSRGSEFQTKIIGDLYSIKIIAAYSNTYVISTNAGETDNNYQKQLIYVPRWKHTTNVSLLYKKHYLRFNQNYVSTIFTSSDNNSWLSPFYVSNLFCGTAFSLKKLQLKIAAGINNLLNENYQVVLNRPMPLRNYQLSININL